eukprot:GFKZ01015772.1.p1 GENE.GFKZ01015772.1~~GFKZ01015772.1.p1  ORF type:complete len:702 (+),score=120.99 GFKZ01015772.1:68-2107(+)
MSTVSHPPDVAPTPPSTKPKKLKRVRKQKPSADATASTSTPDHLTTPPPTLGAPPLRSLTSSRLYLLLLFIRFILIFATTASMEGTEYHDGVDVLAVAILPHMNQAGLDPAVVQPPVGLERDGNRTRSIVGAAITSGIPYAAVRIACDKLLSAETCRPQIMGWVAMLAPRVWMFFLGLLGDYLLVRAFAVYEGDNAVWALLTYASSWTTLLGMARNMNFALESLCVMALVAGCFGWRPNVARPIFWLGGSALALGVFLRPAFVWFVWTIVIYLSSLWGKSGIEPLRYVRAALEGAAICGCLCSLWVSLDSFYYGTFKLRAGGVEIEDFGMFVEYIGQGLPWSYKGSLVYTPLNAMWEVANRKYLSTIAMHTSPGQMFLSLPAILGPLFIVLLRESWDGLKVAMKELMTEMKQVANAKKAKKRKPKKPGMTKDLEDELYVYFDTIQTTFLMGLLIEVVQNNERLGVVSLMSLISPCLVCIAGTIWGPDSSYRFRMLHIAFSAGMVLFYGFLNQAGIGRMMLSAGAGGVDLLPRDADIVVYKGIIGYRSWLGPNLKNISLHDGGDSRLKLMTTLRELKGKDGYVEDKLVVIAPGTVDMKESEFVELGILGRGHMSAFEMPKNIDESMTKSKLVAYRFVGDEDELIIKDDEEAAEREEREREEKEREKQRKRERGGGGKEEL